MEIISDTTAKVSKEILQEIAEFAFYHQIVQVENDEDKFCEPFIDFKELIEQLDKIAEKHGVKEYKDE